MPFSPEGPASSSHWFPVALRFLPRVSPGSRAAVRPAVMSGSPAWLRIGSWGFDGDGARRLRAVCGEWTPAACPARENCRRLLSQRRGGVSQVRPRSPKPSPRCPESRGHSPARPRLECHAGPCRDLPLREHGGRVRADPSGVRVLVCLAQGQSAAWHWGHGHCAHPASSALAPPRSHSSRGRRSGLKMEPLVAAALLHGRTGHVLPSTAPAHVPQPAGSRFPTDVTVRPRGTAGGMWGHGVRGPCGHQLPRACCRAGREETAQRRRKRGRRLVAGSLLRRCVGRAAVRCGRRPTRLGAPLVGAEGRLPWPCLWGTPAGTGVTRGTERKPWEAPDCARAGGSVRDV